MYRAPFHCCILHTTSQPSTQLILNKVDSADKILKLFLLSLFSYCFRIQSVLNKWMLYLRLTVMSQRFLTLTDKLLICRFSQYAKDYWLSPESRSFLLIEMMGKGLSEWGRRSLRTCWPTTHWGRSCSWLRRGRSSALAAHGCLGFPHRMLLAAGWVETQAPLTQVGKLSIAVVSKNVPDVLNFVLLRHLKRNTIKFTLEIDQQCRKLYSVRGKLNTV